jgi:hypothetical protein
MNHTTKNQTMQNLIKERELLKIIKKNKFGWQTNLLSFLIKRRNHSLRMKRRSAKYTEIKMC